MDQKPQITSTPEQGPKILSLEKFSDRGKYGDTPYYNNFPLYFNNRGA